MALATESWPRRAVSPGDATETTRRHDVIEFDVKDMTCSHCASTITRAVKDVDAAGRCEIDIPGKRVRIESSHPAEEFRSAIAEAGYTPHLVERGAAA